MPEKIFLETAEHDAQLLVQSLRKKGKTAAIAESCTAGLVADLLVQIPGASEVFWGSFVCYTVQAKISMLGLDSQRLGQYGPVSKETACDMAQAALAASSAFIAAAVTGVAGPDGDGIETPAGTIWIATVKRAASPLAKKFNFCGSRNEIRNRAAHEVIRELLNILDRNTENQV